MNLSLSLAGLLTSNSLDLKSQKNPRKQPTFFLFIWRISQAAVAYKLQMWILEDFFTVFYHVNWMLVICPVFCYKTVLIWNNLAPKWKNIYCKNIGWKLTKILIQLQEGFQPKVKRGSITASICTLNWPFYNAFSSMRLPT